MKTQKYIYVEPKVFLKKNERGKKKKSLLQRSTKFKQVLHKRGFPNDQ